MVLVFVLSTTLLSNFLALANHITYVNCEYGVSIDGNRFNWGGQESRGLTCCTLEWTSYLKDPAGSPECEHLALPNAEGLDSCADWQLLVSQGMEAIRSPGAVYQCSESMCNDVASCGGTRADALIDPNEVHTVEREVVREADPAPVGGADSSGAASLWRSAATFAMASCGAVLLLMAL